MLLDLSEKIFLPENHKWESILLVFRVETSILATSLICTRGVRPWAQPDTLVNCLKIFNFKIVSM